MFTKEEINEMIKTIRLVICPRFDKNFKILFDYYRNNVYQKEIPIGAGLGVGSSDAATTLRLLSQIPNSPPLTHKELFNMALDILFIECGVHILT